MWQARLRVEEYGYNRITPPSQLHWILKFILILIGGFQTMMWFGGIACFIVFGITGNTDYQTLALAIVLVLLMFLTSLFQSFQEGKSDNVMAALKQLQARKKPWSVNFLRRTEAPLRGRLAEGVCRFAHSLNLFVRGLPAPPRVHRVPVSQLSRMRV